MKKSPLDYEVERVLAQLQKLDPTSEEYSVASENLRIICDARSKKPASIIDWNIVFAIGGNLILGFGIMGYERAGIITSKAFGLLRRI